MVASCSKALMQPGAYPRNPKPSIELSNTLSAPRGRLQPPAALPPTAPGLNLLRETPTADLVASQNYSTGPQHAVAAA